MTFENENEVGGLLDFLINTKFDDCNIIHDESIEDKSRFLDNFLKNYNLKLRMVKIEDCIHLRLVDTDNNSYKDIDHLLLDQPTQFKGIELWP